MIQRAKEVLEAMAEAERQIVIAVGTLQMSNPRVRFSESEVEKIRRAELDLGVTFDALDRHIREIELHQFRTPVEAS